MKKYLFIFAAIIIFLNGWSAGEVSAQAPKTVRVEVEFEFHVGEKIYPAGAYRLETVGSGNILRLRNKENDRQQTIIANASYSGKRQTPKLIFRQLGDWYFLTGVFFAEDNWGFALRPSRRQRESENDRNLASTKTIEVAAKN